MKVVSLLFFFLGYFLVPLSTWAMGKGSSSAPLLMGVMGDSLPSGTLSDTILSVPLPDEAIATQAQEIGAQFLLENKSTLSWASGRNISSHFLRLQQFLGPEKSVEVLNVAAPGAKAEKMPLQASQLVEAMQTGKYQRLEYVALMIGANDACSSEMNSGSLPNPEMTKNLIEALRQLNQISQDSPIHVLVSGLPRIPDLGKPSIQNSMTVGGLTCRFFRNKVVKLCQSLINWNSSEDYEAALQVVQARNGDLNNAVQYANTEFRNLKIFFSESTTQEPVDSEILAADCFHPNSRGQEMISEKLWLEQPWFR